MASGAGANINFRLSNRLKEDVVRRARESGQTTQDWVLDAIRLRIATDDKEKGNGVVR